MKHEYINYMKHENNKYVLVQYMKHENKNIFMKIKTYFLTKRSARKICAFFVPGYFGKNAHLEILHMPPPISPISVLLFNAHPAATRSRAKGPSGSHDNIEIGGPGAQARRMQTLRLVSRRVVIIICI